MDIFEMDENYNNKFYASQIEGSYRSAKRYISFLSKFINPATVVDVGCGRGAWLKAYLEAGAKTAVGIDGPWNTADQMIDDRIDFCHADLSESIAFANSERFELAISLEVAEHLPEMSAQGFVQSLTELSDMVLFGAAFMHQGGTNHINEQKHSYWAAIFANLHYQPFDLFRAEFWGDDEVEFWYRQNTFLYVNKHSAAFEHLTALGLSPLAKLSFMDCVHPVLFEARRLKHEMRSDRILQWCRMLLDQHPQFAFQFEAMVEEAKARVKPET
jgi:SAM-dependent methyltransferase